MKPRRLRKVREWGNTLVVPLSRSDVQDYGIIPGDYMDITDMILIPGHKLEQIKMGGKKDGD